MSFMIRRNFTKEAAKIDFYAIFLCDKICVFIFFCHKEVYRYMGTKGKICDSKGKKFEGMAENMDSSPILHPKKPSNNHSSEFLAKKKNIDA